MQSIFDHQSAYILIYMQAFDPQVVNAIGRYATKSRPRHGDHGHRFHSDGARGTLQALDPVSGGLLVAELAERPLWKKDLGGWSWPGPASGVPSRIAAPGPSHPSSREGPLCDALPPPAARQLDQNLAAANLARNGAPQRRELANPSRQKIAATGKGGWRGAGWLGAGPDQIAMRQIW